MFIDRGASEDLKDHPVFSEKDAISSGLQQVLLLFAGSMKHLNASDMRFEPLLQTGDETGEVSYGDLQQMNPFGGGGGLNPNRRPKPTREYYTLAAHITGELSKEDAEELAAKEAADEAKEAEKKDAEKKAEEDGDKKDEEKAEKKERNGINVVVVADLDLFYQEFFRYPATDVRSRQRTRFEPRQHHLHAERARRTGRRRPLHRHPQAPAQAPRAGHD